MKGSRSLRDHSPQSLTNDEGEGNENGKKPIGLDWQNIYNGHFSLQRESAVISRFVSEENTKLQFSFSFLEL